MHWTKNPDAKSSKWLQREPPRLGPAVLHLVRPSDEENFVASFGGRENETDQPDHGQNQTQTDNMNGYSGAVNNVHQLLST